MCEVMARGAMVAPPSGGQLICWDSRHLPQSRHEGHGMAWRDTTNVPRLSLQLVPKPVRLPHLRGVNGARQDRDK